MESSGDARDLIKSLIFKTKGNILSVLLFLIMLQEKNIDRHFLLCKIYREMLKS